MESSTHSEIHWKEVGIWALAVCSLTCPGPRISWLAMFRLMGHRGTIQDICRWEVWNFSGKQLTSASLFVPLKSIYISAQCSNLLGRYKCCRMHATLCLVAMYVVTCIALCMLTTQLHGQNKRCTILPSVDKQWTLQVCLEGSSLPLVELN